LYSPAPVGAEFIAIIIRRRGKGTKAKEWDFYSLACIPFPSGDFVAAGEQVLLLQYREHSVFLFVSHFAHFVCPPALKVGDKVQDEVRPRP
jgi:hypothetical protein